MRIPNRKQLEAEMRQLLLILLTWLTISAVTLLVVSAVIKNKNDKARTVYNVGGPHYVVKKDDRAY